MIKIIIKIALTLILLGCLLNMPYGYYQFVRVATFVIFAFLAFKAYQDKQTALVIIYAISSVLFNPIFKIALGRQIWQIIDVALAVTLCLTLLGDLRILKKNK